MAEREIDDETIVDEGQTGAVVPAATDGKIQTVAAGEVDGGNDIGNVLTVGDECGTSVDHGIVNGSCPVIVGVGGSHEVSLQPAGERGNGLLIGRAARYVFCF